MKVWIILLKCFWILICELQYGELNRYIPFSLSKSTLFSYEQLPYKGPFKKYVTVKIPIFEPPPPLSPFVTVCLETPSPPCHHPNSDKLFDPKLAKESLGLCLTTLSVFKFAQYYFSRGLEFARFKFAHPK